MEIAAMQSCRLFKEPFFDSTLLLKITTGPSVVPKTRIETDLNIGRHGRGGVKNCFRQELCFREY